MTLRTTAVLIGCVRAASGAMGVAGVRRATVHASASSAAKPAVLWLHGLGDTGAGWQGAFGPLAAAATFHHPTAPTAPVTINGGMQSTSWMDLKSFPVDLTEPQAGSDFDATVASVHGMLEQIEADGTPAEQILIGGFSQGGATSLAAGLAYPRRLAGIVSISGWVAYREDFASRVHAANSAVPVLFTCGTADPVVDFSLTQRSGEMVSEVLGEAVRYNPNPNPNLISSHRCTGEREARPARHAPARSWRDANCLRVHRGDPRPQRRVGRVTWHEAHASLHATSAETVCVCARAHIRIVRGS